MLVFDMFFGDNDIMYYGEGIYFGYCYYDYCKIEFLFFFGVGFFYIIFEYLNICLSDIIFVVNGKIIVQVDVCNIGLRDGKEVVQFYVMQVQFWVVCFL